MTMFWLSSFWLSSKSSQSLRLLGQLFLCIHVDHHWIFHKKITVAQPPELLRPFLGAGKMIKLRQIRQDPEIVAKKLDFVFLFDLFSICFRFFVVRLFFSFLFSILVGFSRFWIKFDKIQKLQKTSSFFSLFSFFSNYFRTEKAFSIDFRIMFESQKQVSNYFRNIFELRPIFWIIFELEAHFDFVFPITSAIATVILATLARFVATS